MKKELNRNSHINRALAVECRIQLLEWLIEPDRHFRDRVKRHRQIRFVAESDIEQKWNVTRSTARKHIHLLKAANLIQVDRLQKTNWIKRNHRGIAVAQAAGHIYIR